MDQSEKKQIIRIADKADRAASKELARHLNIPLPIAELLCQRGIRTTESAQKYLNPKLSDIPSPYELKGMGDAVEVVLEAVATRTKVIIHGDYDVDGITATALLVDFIRSLDLEVTYHLPNRMVEGYGFSLESITRLADQVGKPALLITVDCGIAAVKEVRYAQELGFKVIVTDHHEPSLELPKADAVINPKQPGCNFTCKEISGVGVAFFLVMAIRRAMVERGFWSREDAPNLKNYLDLVALGTVADVMQLVDINRVLVKAGLEVISSRMRPGIWALCECLKTNEGNVSSEDISFRLAPRINAAGRLGNPEIAADLLLARESDRAMQLAATLETANNERRELERTALDEAVQLAEHQVEEGKKGIVLYGADWHPGVIGILAARIVDKFNLPVFVCTKDTAPGSKKLKASGRSVTGLNLFQALQGCQDVLVQFGGHAMAAGLTIEPEHLTTFSEIFDLCIQRMIEQAQPKTVMIDRVMKVEDDCRLIIQGLQQMEPFGHGNHEPIFLLKNIRLNKVSRLREHLKFVVQVNGQQVSGIGFFMEPSFDDASHRVDLSFKLKQTSFRGRKRIEAHAVNIQPTA